MTTRHSRDILQGDLSEQNLPEILQFLHSMQRDGHLLIEEEAVAGRPQRSAGIYFTGGQIVHATCPPLDGEEALFAILGLHTGRFVFLGGQQAPQRSISADFHGLLLEGIRRQDEWYRLLAELPELDRVLYATYDEQVLASQQLSWQQWRIFELIDGRRRLRELVELGGPDPVASLAALRGLYRAGLFHLEAQDHFLAAIVLRRLPAGARDGLPVDPPGLLARHLLRACDGRLDLQRLGRALGAGSHELIVAARHLLRHRWVAPVSGRLEALRYLT